MVKKCLLFETECVDPVVDIWFGFHEAKKVEMSERLRVAKSTYMFGWLHSFRKLCVIVVTANCVCHSWAASRNPNIASVSLPRQLDTQDGGHSQPFYI